MSRINRIIHDGHHIDLVLGNIDQAENTYTVIIGKNGIGKSRLLSSLAKHKTKYDYDAWEDSIPTDGYINSNVIAVSTSPFDKFPSPRKKSLEDANSNYKYIGMRGEGLYSLSSSIALISSAARGLLEKLTKKSNNENLLNVFKTLGFEPNAGLIIKPGYIGKDTVRNSSVISEDSSLYIELLCLERDYGIFVDDRYKDILISLSHHKQHKIFWSLRLINKILQKRKAVELSINFNSDTSQISGTNTDSEYIDAILTLMKHGFMRLIDLHLFKIGHGEISLKKASSGEQCLLVIMLGIAGHIKNGSLILIDEPEVSLHPKWQEEFMLLLTSAFCQYKGCQFVVATHSPQIISRLKAQGCFVTSLSRQKTYNATDFLEKSADFQLAELFDAPGTMNEYISRLAFNLLAKLKAYKSLSPELALDLEHLKILSTKIDQGDPVKELVESVVEACAKYADN